MAIAQPNSAAMWGNCSSKLGHVNPSGETSNLAKARIRRKVATRTKSPKTTIPNTKDVNLPWARTSCSNAT